MSNVGSGPNNLDWTSSAPLNGEGAIDATSSKEATNTPLTDTQKALQLQLQKELQAQHPDLAIVEDLQRRLAEESNVQTSSTNISTASSSTQSLANTPLSSTSGTSAKPTSTQAAPSPTNESAKLNPPPTLSSPPPLTAAAPTSLRTTESASPSSQLPTYFQQQLSGVLYSLQTGNITQYLQDYSNFISAYNALSPSQQVTANTTNAPNYPQGLLPTPQQFNQLVLAQQNAQQLAPVSNSAAYAAAYLSFKNAVEAASQNAGPFQATLAKFFTSIPLPTPTPSLPSEIASDLSNAQTALQSGNWQDYISAYNTLNQNYLSLTPIQQQAVQVIEGQGFPSSDLPTPGQIQALQQSSSAALGNISSLFNGISSAQDYEKNFNDYTQQLNQILQALPASTQALLKAGAPTLPSLSVVQSLASDEAATIQSLNKLLNGSAEDTSSYTNSLSTFTQDANTLINQLPASLQAQITGSPASTFPSAQTAASLFTAQAAVSNALVGIIQGGSDSSYEQALAAFSSTAQGFIQNLPSGIQSQVSPSIASSFPSTESIQQYLSAQQKAGSALNGLLDGDPTQAQTYADALSNLASEANSLVQNLPATLQYPFVNASNSSFPSAQNIQSLLSEQQSAIQALNALASGTTSNSQTFIQDLTAFTQDELSVTQNLPLNIQSQITNTLASKLPNPQAVQQFLSSQTNAISALNALTSGSSSNVTDYTVALDSLSSAALNLTQNLPANIQSEISDALASNFPTSDQVQTFVTDQTTTLSNLNTILQGSAVNSSSYTDSLTALSQATQSLTQNLPSNIQAQIKFSAESALPTGDAIGELIENQNTTTSLLNAILNGGTTDASAYTTALNAYNQQANSIYQDLPASFQAKTSLPTLFPSNQAISQLTTDIQSAISAITASIQQGSSASYTSAFNTFSTDASSILQNLPSSIKAQLPLTPGSNLPSEQTINQYINDQASALNSLNSVLQGNQASATTYTNALNTLSQDATALSKNLSPATQQAIQQASKESLPSSQTLEKITSDQTAVTSSLSALLNGASSNATAYNSSYSTLTSDVSTLIQTLPQALQVKVQPTTNPFPTSSSIQTFLSDQSSAIHALNGLLQGTSATPSSYSNAINTLTQDALSITQGLPQGLQQQISVGATCGFPSAQSASQFTASQNNVISNLAAITQGSTSDGYLNALSAYTTALSAFTENIPANLQSQVTIVGTNSFPAAQNVNQYLNDQTTATNALSSYLQGQSSATDYATALSALTRDASTLVQNLPASLQYPFVNASASSLPTVVNVQKLLIDQAVALQALNALASGTTSDSTHFVQDLTNFTSDVSSITQNLPANTQSLINNTISNKLPNAQSVQQFLSAQNSAIQALNNLTNASSSDITVYQASLNNLTSASQALVQNLPSNVQSQISTALASSFPTTTSVQTYIQNQQAAISALNGLLQGDETSSSNYTAALSALTQSSETLTANLPANIQQQINFSTETALPSADALGVLVTDQKTAISSLQNILNGSTLDTSSYTSALNAITSQESSIFQSLPAALQAKISTPSNSLPSLQTLQAYVASEGNALQNLTSALQGNPLAGYTTSLSAFSSASSALIQSLPATIQTLVQPTLASKFPSSADIQSFQTAQSGTVSTLNDLLQGKATSADSYTSALGNLSQLAQNLAKNLPANLQTQITTAAMESLPSADSVQTLLSTQTLTIEVIQNFVSGYSSTFSAYKNDLANLQTQTSALIQSIPASLQGLIATPLANTLPSSDQMGAFIQSEANTCTALSGLLNGYSTDTTNYSSALASFQQTSTALLNSLPASIKSLMPAPMAPSMPTVSSLQNVFAAQNAVVTSLQNFAHDPSIGSTPYSQAAAAFVQAVTAAESSFPPNLKYEATITPGTAFPPSNFIQQYQADQQAAMNALNGLLQGTTTDTTSYTSALSALAAQAQLLGQGFPAGTQALITSAATTSFPSAQSILQASSDEKSAIQALNSLTSGATTNSSTYISDLTAFTNDISSINQGLPASTQSIVNSTFSNRLPNSQAVSQFLTDQTITINALNAITNGSTSDPTTYSNSLSALSSAANALTQGLPANLQSQVSSALVSSLPTTTQIQTYIDQQSTTLQALNSILSGKVANSSTYTQALSTLSQDCLALTMNLPTNVQSQINFTAEVSFPSADAAGALIENQKAATAALNNIFNGTTTNTSAYSQALQAYTSSTSSIVQNLPAALKSQLSPLVSTSFPQASSLTTYIAATQSALGNLSALIQGSTTDPSSYIQSLTNLSGLFSQMTQGMPQDIQSGLTNPTSLLPSSSSPSFAALKTAEASVNQSLAGIVNGSASDTTSYASSFNQFQTAAAGLLNSLPSNLKSSVAASAGSALLSPTSSQLTAVFQARNTLLSALTSFNQATPMSATQYASAYSALNQSINTLSNSFPSSIQATVKQNTSPLSSLPTPTAMSQIASSANTCLSTFNQVLTYNPFSQIASPLPLYEGSYNSLQTQLAALNGSNCSADIKNALSSLSISHFPSPSDINTLGALKAGVSDAFTQITALNNTFNQDPTYAGYASYSSNYTQFKQEYQQAVSNLTNEITTLKNQGVFPSFISSMQTYASSIPCPAIIPSPLPPPPPSPIDPFGPGWNPDPIIDPIPSGAGWNTAIDGFSDPVNDIDFENDLGDDYSPENSFR